MTKSRTNADNVTADIAGITAGTGITGGGTSGTVTITNDMATTIAAKGDLLAGTANDAYSALTVGANNLVLTADSAQATGLKWAAPDPVTTKGDLFTYSTTEDRLGVGANDTVLTADSTAATGLKWATPAAGGMTLLSTTTLSGSSTTISSISGSYKSLYAYIYGVTVTTLGADIWINPNNTNNITTQGGIQNSDGTGSIAQPAAAGTLRLNQGQPILNTGGANAWDLTINNYASTTTNKSHNVNGGYKINGGSSCSYMVAGYINTTSAITSLVFTLGTGTYNGGTVLLYGVN